MPKSLFPHADDQSRQRLRAEHMFLQVTEFDWSGTALGPLAEWPETLRSAIRMMLSTQVPMVLLVGEDGVLVYNSGYAEIAADKHPSILGKRAIDAWPEVADFNRSVIERGLAGEHLSFSDVELALERNGALSPAWFDIEYSPLYDDSGTPVAVFAVIIETTERVLGRRAVRRAEERVELALSGSGIVGTWDWDVAADRVVADERFARMFSVDPAAAAAGVALDSFVAQIDEADRARVAEEIARAVESGGDLRSEYRVRNSSGRLSWVMASGRPHRGADGKVDHFPGVLVDITEQKLAAQALAESEARFRTLADTMPQMVWSMSPEGIADYFNARWYDFTAQAEGETRAEFLADLLHPEDRTGFSAAWREALASGEPLRAELRLRHHSGEHRWVLCSAALVRDGEGRAVRWIGSFTDIHETRQFAEEREMVAQEMSHRIKNIFSVLVGIVGLSARNRPDVRPFAEQLRERMIALGRAHDLVRPHSRKSAVSVAPPTFSSLISQLLEPYANDAGPAVVFEGEDVPIDDGAATPLALLIHELATNAAKYGALAHEGGRIVIAGSVDGESYTLRWRENGVPVADHATKGAGFGSRLISLSVEGQMGGKVRRTWRDDGLEVEIALPLAALSRSSGISSPAGGTA